MHGAEEPLFHSGTRITFSLSCGLGWMNKARKLIYHVGEQPATFSVPDHYIKKHCSTERENRMGALIHSQASFGNCWSLVTAKSNC